MKSTNVRQMNKLKAKMAKSLNKDVNKLSNFKMTKKSWIPRSRKWIIYVLITLPFVAGLLAYFMACFKALRTDLVI